MSSERRIVDYAIYLLLLIAGLVLLVPGAIYAHGMMSPQPILIRGDDADGAIVIAQVSVVPWVTLFFITLLDGVVLTIFGLVLLLFKNRDARLGDDLKTVVLVVSIMTMATVALFAGSAIFSYFLPVSFRAAGFFLLIALAIIGRWLRLKGFFGDRISGYAFIAIVTALILDGLSMIFQVTF